jgi:hypothetical protein
MTTKISAYATNDFIANSKYNGYQLQQNVQPRCEARVRHPNFRNDEVQSFITNLL